MLRCLFFQSSYEDYTDEEDDDEDESDEEREGEDVGLPQLRTVARRWGGRVVGGRGGGTEWGIDAPPARDQLANVSHMLCHCKVACINNTISLMFGCKKYRYQEEEGASPGAPKLHQHPCHQHPMGVAR
ncbi:discs large homolog 1-like protein, partial [Lates japonicus]